jgi:hypothetical protein
MIQQARQVGFKTIIDLLKRRRIRSLIGILFTLIPIFSATIFLSVLTLTNSDVPKVDYKLINEKGTVTHATITNIETQTNITINNEHPSIISYTYLVGDKDFKSKVQTLTPEIVDKMNVGDSVKIKYLESSSIITGLEPLSFPLYIFFIAAVPIFTIGVLTLLFLYIKIKSDINLFQYGKVRDAELLSMIPRPGLPISGFGRGVTVNYQYKTASGENALGESVTSDFSILNSKKQGDLIKIFVSADNESKSCLINKLDEIRNNWKIE